MTVSFGVIAPAFLPLLTDFAPMSLSRSLLRFRSYLAVMLLALPGVSLAEDVILFPYFDANGQNGVYLSWSKDGRNFEAANGGKPIFTPPQWGGGQNLTRDPSIVYHDGLFHMVWTSNWSGTIFGHASSPDLVTWSTPQQVRPFPLGGEQPNNVWAPEIFRDHVAGDYKIVWSSTLPSELNDGDGSGDSHNADHRMYYVATTNFQSYSAPQLLFQDEGYSVIDAHVVWQPTGAGANDGRWVMSLKKEQGTEQGGKNIRLAFSDAAIGPSSFGQTTQPIVGPGSSIRGNEVAEGSSMVFWDDKWLMYWDAYGNGHYSMASSPDLTTWTDETDDISFPVNHPRHGSVMIADKDDVGWRLAARADLNDNGMLDPGDWTIFNANHLTNLAPYNELEQSLRGDLDGDGDNDFDDFRLFQSDYDNANGAGAFAALRAVPEPGAAALMTLGIAGGAARQRR
jgi:hypothetical protein